MGTDELITNDLRECSPYCLQRMRTLHTVTLKVEGTSPLNPRGWLLLSGKNAIFAQIIQAAYATHLYLPQRLSLETDRCILVFDYWMDPAGVMLRLLQSPKPLYVFSSHFHEDHSTATSSPGGPGKRTCATSFRKTS